MKVHKMKGSITKDTSVDRTTNRVICFIALFMGGAFGFFYGVRYWGNGLQGSIVGLIIGIFAYFLGRTIMNVFAKVFGSLAGERTAHWTIREQLQGDMDQALHCKRRKEYPKALNIVNKIIHLDPNFPDALFLKAQIVWEGFRNHKAAKSNIKTIMNLVKDEKETIYQWALSLSKEIDEALEKK